MKAERRRGAKWGKGGRERGAGAFILLPAEADAEARIHDERPSRPTMVLVNRGAAAESRPAPAHAEGVAAVGEGPMIKMWLVGSRDSA